MPIGRRADISDLGASAVEKRTAGSLLAASNPTVIDLFAALRSTSTASGELIKELDHFLRFQAMQTGELAFLRAANALYHQNSGRPSIDDQRLIGEAQWLVENGKVKSLNQALLRVARTRVDEDRVKNVAERLRRKIALQREDRST